MHFKKSVKNVLSIVMAAAMIGTSVTPAFAMESDVASTSMTSEIAAEIEPEQDVEVTEITEVNDTETTETPAETEAEPAAEIKVSETKKLSVKLTEGGILTLKDKDEKVVMTIQTSNEKGKVKVTDKDGNETIAALTEEGFYEIEMEKDLVLIPEVNASKGFEVSLYRITTDAGAKDLLKEITKKETVAEEDKETASETEAAETEKKEDVITVTGETNSVLEVSFTKASDEKTEDTEKDADKTEEVITEEVEVIDSTEDSANLAAVNAYSESDGGSWKDVTAQLKAMRLTVNSQYRYYYKNIGWSNNSGAADITYVIGINAKGTTYWGTCVNPNKEGVFARPNFVFGHDIIVGSSSNIRYDQEFTAWETTAPVFLRELYYLDHNENGTKTGWGDSVAGKMSNGTAEGAGILAHAAAAKTAQILGYDGYKSNANSWKEALNGSGQSAVSRYIAKVSTLPVPDNYKVYVLQAHGSRYQNFAFAAPSFTEDLGYMTLVKQSADPYNTTGNPLYSLAGAEYGVYSDDACTKSVGTLVIKEDGTSDNLKLTETGTYYVKETKAPKNFKLDKTVHSVSVTAANTASNPAKLVVKDDWMNDPVSITIQKKDAVTGKFSEGLAGAQFTVKYYALDTEEIGENIDPATKGYEPRYTWIFETDKDGRVTFDDKHKISGTGTYMNSVTGHALLPLGILTVQETKAPEGYLLEGQTSAADDSFEAKVHVINTVTDEAGNVTTSGAPDHTLVINEQPLRGGMKFTKTDESGKPMAGVPFLVTSEATGEKHVIVSDANGVVNTEAVKHSVNTNANDELVKETKDGALYIAKEDIAKLSSETGIWFSGSDSKATAKDDAMALHEGTYTITEISAEGINSSKSLWEISGIAVSEAGKIVTPGSEIWVNKGIEIGTTAKNADADTKNIAVTETAKVEDTVAYKNLLPGETYTVKGTLHYKNEKGEVKTLLNEDGSEVTAETTFTTPGTKSANRGAETVDGEVKVVFTFDSSLVENKELVAYEELWYKGIYKIDHKNIEDEKQTVYVPSVGTTLTESTSGTHVATAKKNVSLTDTVAFTNLAPGETYIIKGSLIDKKTGDVIAKADSEKFTVSKEDNTGKKDVVFKDIDLTKLAGHTLVAFEKLYVIADGKEVEIAKHEDKEDAEQSIHIPSVKTTAVDEKTQEHIGVIGKEAVVVDKVQTGGLLIGKTYTVKGVLHVKEEKDGKVVDGGALLDKDGKEITAETTFTAAKEQEEVLISFHLDSSLLQTKTVVAFEDLYQGDVKVGAHADIADEDQTVHYPDVKTSAKDISTKDDVGVSGKASVVDTVKLTNLVPGKEYVVSGYLVNQADGQPVLVNGEKITQSANIRVSADGVITADGGEEVTSSYNKAMKSVDGTVDLTFTFDSSVLTGQSIVVFEDLKNNDIVVASHSDLRDKDQTVHYPNVRTEAMDEQTGDHVGSIFGKLMNSIRSLLGEKDVSGDGIEDAKEQTILDRVSLTNLVPGKEYTVKGTLMNQETGKAVEVNGKTITQEAVITVSEDGKIVSKNGEKTEVTEFNKEKNSVNGSVVLTFKVDSSYLQGATVVVFEDLLHKGTKVAVHNDIRDNSQSVHEVEIKTTAIDTQTGDHVAGVPSEDAVTRIDDTVAMTKLVKGMTYTLTGKLVDKDASTKDRAVYLTNKDGEEYVTTVTFTADAEHLKDYKEDANGASVSGNIVISFMVENDLLQGKTTVVFEDLFHNGVRISAHADLTDKDQTVYFPTGKTNATDIETGLHESLAAESVTITDRVYFENLLAGKEYTIHGTLHYKDDADLDGNGVIDENEPKAGALVLDENGSVVFANKTFVVSADLAEKDGFTGIVAKDQENGDQTVSGYADVVFTVNTKALEGRTIVAFEEFIHNDVTVCTHADLSDLPQTVRIPEIRTTAKTEELDETAIYDENGEYKEISIIDTVHYKNLWTSAELEALKEAGIHIQDGDNRNVYDIKESGKYIVSGTLMDKQTGEPLADKDGNIFTSVSEIFEAGENGEGDIAVAFTVDPAKFEDGELEGKTLVVFETLYRVEDTDEPELTKIVAKHEDIDDAEQDVRFPKGRTHATDVVSDAADSVHEQEENSTAHEAKAADEVKILDQVSYENLHTGTTYSVTGTLQVITERDENGKPVAWEPAKDDNGEVITATREFTTPEAEDESASVSGVVDVLFTFPGLSLAGKTTVAFETFTRDGQEVMVHADITDDAQTVYLPKIGTSASDSVTGTHEGLVSEKSYIIDAVSYENLEAGKTYSLAGTLMNKASKEAAAPTVTGQFVAGTENQFIMADGKTVVSTLDDVKKALAEGKSLADADKKEDAVLTGKDESQEEKPGDAQKAEPAAPAEDEEPKAPADAQNTDEPVSVDEPASVVEAEDAVSGRVSGVVYIVLPVDSTKIAGGSVVAFEKLYAKDTDENDKEIAVHEDIEDGEQTVTFPQIGTKASVDGKNTAMISKSTKLVDTVSYKGLTIGQEYTVTGVLMDKATGKEITVGGKSVTVTATFKPEKTDGQAEVVFTFDSSSLGNKTVVVFETVTTKADTKDIVVGEHKDLNDKDQSVSFTTPPDSRVQTGDTPVLPYVLGAGAAIVILAVVLLVMKKKKN